MTITNGLSFDIEEYFHAEALRSVLRDTSKLESRVARTVETLLAVLAAHETHATFFVLGSVAERHPQLVPAMAAAGHEIASHGWSHTRIDRLTPAEFDREIRRSRELLAEQSGQPVIGFRAPTFSIGGHTPWAFGLLARAGYRYDSSVYPVRHDLYGDPTAPRRPYQVAGGALLEIPMTTRRAFGRQLPASGGGFFRLLPYPVFRSNLRAAVAEQQRPGVFYLHPWELDPAQPRAAGLKLRSRFRHYLNLGHTEARLHRLLGDFRWDRMDRVFLQPHLAEAA